LNKKVIAMFQGVQALANMIFLGRNKGLTDREFFELELAKWQASPRRILQIKGQLYYDGAHDILTRKRTVIGDNGRLQSVDNLPNNRIIDNQYAKLVSQKANYIAGKPIAIDSENKAYLEALKPIFGKSFMRTLKNAVKASLNHGVSWLYPYYDDIGRLAFRLFPGYEILPFWADSEHTVLDAAIRMYEVQAYEGRTPIIIHKVELYDKSGVQRYTWDGGKLTPEADRASYVTTVYDNAITGFNWERIPLIPIKYNEREIPLLKKVKSLQDGVNVMLSDFENNMQEDSRNTILVLKNYDGERLEDFRHKLTTYGAIKVRCDGEARGGVETLQIEVKAENYKSILELFKKALIENGMGYDAKDDRLSGNPNQMNIQSMYSDIDLDANDMETELQAAFEQILWFVDAYLANAGIGDFDGEAVHIIFNRDILINETEAIQNCQASMGILSLESIVKQHPWTEDLLKELELLEKQKQEEREDMYNQTIFPEGGVKHEPASE